MPDDYNNDGAETNANYVNDNHADSADGNDDDNDANDNDDTDDDDDRHTKESFVWKALKHDLS